VGVGTGGLEPVGRGRGRFTAAPWFGNFYSGTNESPPQGYDDYQYYTLWELFGNVADVFQERERYEALAQVHTDLVSTIQADLPPEDERPTAIRATLSRTAPSSGPTT